MARRAVETVGAFAHPFFGGHKRLLFSAVRRIHATAPRMDVSAAVPPKLKKLSRMPAIIRPMVPSEKLKSFVEDRAQPRSDVLKSIVAYARERELQDPNNKTMIICDEKLGDLLGVEKCTILEISKYISKHLMKPEEVGGRYLEQAAKIEKEYLANYVPKQKEPSKSKRKSGSDKERSDRDRAAGTRLFKPVLLSDELSALCGGQKELPRQEIIKSVWDYIKGNNLKGPPGEPVRCDALMEKVFGSKTVTVQGVMKGISVHVTKKVD